jgi:predicted DNA-binding ribbon-helix-helix protein
MKSTVVKRSIAISSHKTSVSLEDAFWRGLKEIALARGLTVSELVTLINSGRPAGNLSSAIRLCVLDHYRTVLSTSASQRITTKERAADNPAQLPPDRR